MQMLQGARGHSENMNNQQSARPARRSLLNHWTRHTHTTFLGASRRRSTIWLDPDSTLIYHLVSSGSAKAVFRDAHHRRHVSARPEYRLNNDVPNRLSRHASAS